jgi:death-on-curing protein
VPRQRQEPIWLDRLVLDAMHVDLIRTHGGLSGIRDENALESTLARPQHKWHYGRANDLATLAAAYAHGLARNHPYRDGNKRIAFLALAVFLGLNGKDLDATEADVVTTMLRLADGSLSENALAKWVREHIVPYRIR